MDIQTLNRAVEDDAAVRRRQRLQPSGGPGDKIFPPTYPGEGRNNPPPRHVYERRRRNGQDSWCVLIDSVQSQANRLEECLLGAIAADIPVPHIVVDFRNADLAGISKITSLDAPHRVYDAIFRDSLLDGEPFMNSAIGQRLAKAKPEDATALLEISPTALLFGSWHSTGEGGGVGAKFARCLVSEIVGIDVPVDEVLVNRRTGELEIQTSGRRTGSRIDPLGVLKKVEVFKGESGWATSAAAAGKKAKKVRPSEINHGNIAPSIQPLGVTCDHVEHSFVLSFAALRRLRFGDGDKTLAGRSLLAALGLLALAEQDARGYALRSRCDLVCDGRAALELVHPDGATGDLSIDRTSARALYRQAFENAVKTGFKLSAEPLLLTPQDKLVEIVRKSQELALSGAGGEEEDAPAAE
ncbi:MAG TPA: type I-U CRISPR-associated RAMP protein Csb1/Cas7u [Terriglobales bacterium]|nr:type I-U CRISPR-associated RAMP protein Csb1/Cas7u [Terriglobales bacterium]